MPPTRIPMPSVGRRGCSWEAAHSQSPPSKARAFAKRRPAGDSEVAARTQAAPLANRALLRLRSAAVRKFLTFLEADPAPAREFRLRARTSATATAAALGSAAARSARRGAEKKDAVSGTSTLQGLRARLVVPDARSPRFWQLWHAFWPNKQARLPTPTTVMCWPISTRFSLLSSAAASRSACPCWALHGASSSPALHCLAPP